MDDDTISRQAAYEVLTAYYHHATDIQHAALHDALSKVPSAERHGRWTNGNEGKWNAVIVPKCSICGETFYEMNVNINGEYTYNYCPYCGAKMDEVEE